MSSIKHSLVRYDEAAPPLPVATNNTTKEATVAVKVAKPNDPLGPIQTLLDATRGALREQPEQLQRPFAVAGLRVIIAEIERTIATLETNHG
jgi:hypothetical protein